MRDVLAERQPMAEWSDEQKEAMIRYTLQLQARAGSSGSAGGASSAGGPVRLSELMEASMSMYQSLIMAQQQSATQQLHAISKRCIASICALTLRDAVCDILSVCYGRLEELQQATAAAQASRLFSSLRVFLLVFNFFFLFTPICPHC